MTECKTCTKCKQSKTLAEFYKHKGGKFGVRADCKECQAIYNKAWCEKNTKLNRANSKAWAEANKELVRANRKARDEANPERKKAQRKEYHEANREKSRVYSKAWVEANPERHRANSKAWAEANQDKRRDIKNRRRARKRNATFGPVPTLFELFTKQGGMCANCKTDGVDVAWHLDHIMPLALGGAHMEDNVQVLCQPCNNRKGAKPPEQWELENGRLPLNFGAR